MQELDHLIDQTSNPHRITQTYEYQRILAEMQIAREHRRPSVLIEDVRWVTRMCGHLESDGYRFEHIEDHDIKVFLEEELPPEAGTSTFNPRNPYDSLEVKNLTKEEFYHLMASETEWSLSLIIRVFGYRVAKELKDLIIRASKMEDPSEDIKGVYGLNVQFPNIIQFFFRQFGYKPVYEHGDIYIPRKKSRAV